ncbi:MAG: hypothetical protein JKX80_03015 [Candidatus Pacebacteria bacterium]|nr:hypothetical protein [Candidatus Paceibacterota bacterium]
MKWIALIVGGILIVAGVWLVLKPSSADSPAVEDIESGEIMEGAEHEDGTLDSGSSGASGTQPVGSVSTELDTNNITPPPFTEEIEPVGLPAAPAAQAGDPIFHALVEYTDANGFQPATVSIVKGETIRFVNMSDRGVWVGGNSHPTHTQYPEKSSNDCLGTSFDTCRILTGAAEFWEFTFNEVGTWRYHNHIRPNDGGVVVVK